LALYHGSTSTGDILFEWCTPYIQDLWQLGGCPRAGGVYGGNVYSDIMIPLAFITCEKNIHGSFPSLPGTFCRRDDFVCVINIDESGNELDI
jgi:hypothetical protein